MLLLKKPFWMSPTFTGDGPWWLGFILQVAEGSNEKERGILQPICERSPSDEEKKR
jgi:hypothetical protein